MPASSSNFRRSAAAVAAVFFLVAGLTGIARAQTDQSDVDRLKDVLRSTTIALRAAQDDNAALTASQGQLTAQVAALKQQLAALQSRDGGIADLKAKLDGTEASARAAQAEADESRGLISKWQQAYTKAASFAQAQDSAAKALDRKSRQLATGLNRCLDRNAKLVGIATEILDHLQHQSTTECLARSDSITGIYRVKLENMSQDYGDKIEDQQIMTKDR